MQVKTIHLLFLAVVWMVYSPPLNRVEAQEPKILRGFEFKNSLHANATNKLDLLPWRRSEIDRVSNIINWLYKTYPGFLKQVGKYGPVPLYRVSKRQLDYVDQPAYAGSIYVGFFDFPPGLFVEGSVIHEFVHIADSFRQFSASPEWISLIAPRIKRVVDWRNSNGINKPFSGWGRTSPVEKNILGKAGLPSFYAASSPTEALADIVQYIAMGKRIGKTNYNPPKEIVKYLNRTILSKTLISYPAGEYYFKGLVLNFQGKFSESLVTTELAAKADPKNYIMVFSVAYQKYWLNKIRSNTSLKQFIDSLQSIIKLVPAIDTTYKSYFYRQAAEMFLKDGNVEAMMDICKQLNIDFPESTRGPREYYAYVTCGDAHNAAGNLEAALEKYEKAVALVPFRQYQLTNRMGNIRMALAPTRREAWKALDDVILAQWIGLAEKGQPGGMLVLGKMYFWGTQVAKNYVLALKWLNEAQRNGKIEASYFLAELYRNEVEDFYDLGRARYWAEIAATSGSINGEYIVGVVKIDAGEIEEGLSVLEKAAAKGNSRAAKKLGEFYTSLGMSKIENGDVKQGLLLLMQEAAKGYNLAALKLGDLYASGSINDSNPNDAVKWYEQAAKGNIINAQYALGQYYLANAQPKLALSWFRKSANKGHVLSQFEFGMMAGDMKYSGLPNESPKYGYMWIYRSLNNTKLDTQNDLPAEKIKRANVALKRIAKLLGPQVSVVKKQIDDLIRKELDKPPWQR